jgi:hypothetical protein
MEKSKAAIPTGLGLQPTSPIAIIVTPAFGRPGFFNVHHDGRHLCTSTTPAFTAARELEKQGFDPDAMLETWRPDGRAWDLRVRLGVASKLTVEEGNFAVKLRRWKALSRGDGSPPIAPPPAQASLASKISSAAPPASEAAR